MTNDCVAHIKGMNPQQVKVILNGKHWTESRRLNYKYAILMAQRARLADDDPRKNGIMLERCRILEALMAAL